MFTRNSWRSPVYWVFRVYGLCVLIAVVLHIVGWVRADAAYHRRGNQLLIVGVGIGFMPLLVAGATRGYESLLRGRDRK